MNRGLKALIVSALTLIVGVASVVVLLKINQSSAQETANVQFSQSGDIQQRKSADLIDKQDHSINVILFAITVLSATFGVVYWVFGLLDSKEKLEIEQHQKGLTDNILDKINLELKEQQTLFLSYKDKLSDSIDRLETVIVTKDHQSNQAIAHLKQLIEETIRTRQQDKELFLAEIRHVSNRIDFSCQRINELDDMVGQLEGFLQKNYTDFYKRRSTKIGPFFSGNKTTIDYSEYSIEGEDVEG